VAWLLDNLRRSRKGEPLEPSPGEAAIEQTERRLDDDIRLDFDGTSLDNALKYISAVKRNLNLVPDPELAAEGIDLATRLVTIKTDDLPVRAVLRRILGEDLGFIIRPGYVLVTTREKEYAHLPVVTYPIQDLLSPSPATGRPVDPSALTDALRKAVNQESDSAVAPWVDEGGPAASDATNGFLVVTQTREGHQKVRQFLEALRRTRGLPSR